MISRYARRQRRVMGLPSASIKFQDNYIPVVYYLSSLLKDRKEVQESAVDAITNLIVKADLVDKANKILEHTKEKLVRRNILKPISEGKLKDLSGYIADTNCKYEFDIDKQIERAFGIDNINAILQLNLYRVALSVSTPVLSEFINKVFFYEEGCGTDKKISSKIKREINSTKKVQFLIDKAGLSKEEALCILIRFRLTYTNELCKVMHEYDIDIDDAIIQLLNVTQSQYRKMNLKDSKLKSYGFINEDNELSDDLIECIVNNSLDPFFSEYLKPIDCSNAFSLDTFNVPENTTNIMENLLVHQDSTSILLYGKPGSGKTEYAKSLAKETGYHTYIFKNENELLSGMSSIARLNCFLSIKQNDTVVIVDEADKILQTMNVSMFGPIVPSATKGTVNQMLENNQNKIIWIINHTKLIDESTKRRFTMSYKFDSMPVSMLRSITKTKLEPLNLSEQLENDVISLFNKYSVTGASVNNIVKTISAFQSPDTDDSMLLSSVKTVLQENSKLLDTRSSKMRETVSSSYNPDVINASVDADKIVQMVKNAQKFSELNNSTENGIRMLFYGISGSGKTELVRYISEQLGKKILIRRPSDIMSKYVGDNEANLKAAFEQAAQEDMILLFDEADTFFGDRSNANQSWEIATTNEFLTQMEEFPGILICTTNLKKIMDPAMERRFHIMVEFKPMKKEGIKALLSSYFASYDFTENQIDRLFNIGTVTPGDFGSLSSRIRFMNPEDINASYIIDELATLQDDKHYEDDTHHSIGFSTF